MPVIKHKPHYFELSMRSVSTDENGDLVLNQEVPLVREYANTPGELTVKQMQFTKSEHILTIVESVIKIMDDMSMPFQEIGVAELAAQLQTLGVGTKGPKGPKA